MIDDPTNVIESVAEVERKIEEFILKHTVGSLSNEELTLEVKKALNQIRETTQRLDRLTNSHLCEIRRFLEKNLPLSATFKPDAPGSQLEKNSAFEKLRKFSRGAEELIIADPYFFGGEAQGCSVYISDIVKASRLKTAQMRRLRVLYDKTKGQTKIIIQGFRKVCSNHSINLTAYSTAEIHDRFWIKDRTSGIHIGTSLGGLGKRLCFINRMGPTDVTHALDFLREQKLL